jgi:hypothetical protein
MSCSTLLTIDFVFNTSSRPSGSTEERVKGGLSSSLSASTTVGRAITIAEVES